MKGLIFLFSILFFYACSTEAKYSGNDNGGEIPRLQDDREEQTKITKKKRDRSSASKNKDDDEVEEEEEEDEVEEEVEEEVVDPNTPVTRGSLTQDATNPAIWIFKVPAGTANGDWNTDATKMVLKNGEILRLVFEEAGHNIHTNGQPCGHDGDRQLDANLAPDDAFSRNGGASVGGAIECDINVNQDLVTNGQRGMGVYDHITNGNIFANFYVNDIPQAILDSL